MNVRRTVRRNKRKGIAAVEADRAQTKDAIDRRRCSGFRKDESLAAVERRGGVPVGGRGEAGVGSRTRPGDISGAKE